MWTVMLLSILVRLQFLKYKLIYRLIAITLRLGRTYKNQCAEN